MHKSGLNVYDGRPQFLLLTAMSDFDRPSTRSRQTSASGKSWRRSPSVSKRTSSTKCSHSCRVGPVTRPQTVKFRSRRVCIDLGSQWNERGKQMRLEEEALVRHLDVVPRRHAPALVGESLLLLESTQMLDQGVAEDQVERAVFERQMTRVALDDTQVRDALVTRVILVVRRQEVQHHNVGLDG